MNDITKAAYILGAGLLIAILIVRYNASIPSEVYIDSVYPNPPGSKIPEVEPWMEWVKICNPKSEPVNLGGWKLGDRESTWTFPSSYWIPAKDCVVITGKRYNFQGLRQGVFLNNNGDEVILISRREGISGLMSGGVVDVCEFGKVRSGEVVRCKPRPIWSR